MNATRSLGASLRFAARGTLVMCLLLASAANAVAQTQLILARTPSRGGIAGGTKVEVVGNGWFFAGFTTVTMSGGTSQPTNLVVQDNSHLTFLAPPRPIGACPTVGGVPNTCTITVTVAITTTTVRTVPFTYVARTQNALPGARHPVFNYSGQYMAFESRYALVPGDTNGLIDIYVRTKATGALHRVSIASSGAQALGGESTSPAISADGRFIAFQSRATNLVPGDTNGVMDVFVHDRDADGNGVFDEAGSGKESTERVDIGIFCGAACFPAQASGGDSSDPTISGNGRYVAFTSAATNLVSGDANNKTDVFVFDRLRRATRLVSANINNVPAGNASRNPAMNITGRFVAFESLADDIAGGNPGNGTTGPITDIFLRDRDTDENGIFDEPGNVATFLVSVNPCEANLTNHSIEPSITYDGRYVVFATAAANAKVDSNCANADFNRVRDIFIWDRFLGTVARRLSEGQFGELPGASGAPVISGNGNLLLFRTQAINAGGGPQSPGIVGAAGNDGKSTTGGVPDPTGGTPPPADLPPAPDTGSTEDPTTSGDGNTQGNTTEPDPGTGGGEPVVDVDETPEVGVAAPFIAGLSPASGPTAGGAIVEIQGGNFIAGQTTVVWNGANLVPSGVNATRLFVTTPAAAAGPVTVRVLAGTAPNAQSSNEVEYNYVAGLTAPQITSFTLASESTVGGNIVQITGTGFAAGASVRFGPNASPNVVFVNSTRINATAPASAVAGPVPLVVQNTNGTTAVSDAPYVYTFAAAVSAPDVPANGVSPDHGPVTGGTSITITGTNFAPGATVTIGGVAATDVQVLSSTQIVAVTPAGAEGPANVVVTTTNGPSEPQTFLYDPLAPAVLTCTGTDTDLDGMPDAWEDQYGFNKNDGSDGALDADSDGVTNAGECTALTHPRGNYTRYLAEGATGAFFDTRVVVANPGVTPARVLFRFQTDTGGVVRHFLVIPALARRTVDLRLLSGLASANISTVLETDVQVVLDRTMRWDNVSRFGAHAETSVPAPSLIWYLAEGATHGAFDLFYLLQNPSQTQASQVRIRYLLPSGSPLEQIITVPPNTRTTVYVDQQPGLSATDVSAVIESLNAVPIIVERAMYSSAAGTFAAGHDSAGVTAPALEWFFAEGATGGFFDEFLLFANPGGSDASLRATYLLPDGTTFTKDYTVPANSRRTVNVQFEDARLASTAVSVRVASLNAVPFLAERSMWWPHGQNWIEASNAAGATTTGTKWAVADGEAGTLPDDTATFILVANTSAFAATVRVTLLFETGSPITRDFTVPANSRFNVPVLTTDVPDAPTIMRVPRGTRFSSVIESLGGTPAQIVVERAMYWNAQGQLWAAGSDLLATKLQ